MELDMIDFSNNKIRLTINDPVKQVCYVIELEAGEFFDKIASAFYSAKATKAEEAQNGSII